MSIPENPETDNNGLKMQMVYSSMDKNDFNQNSSTITYNKLVRDKIPQIVMADNKKCEISTVTDKEKFTMLQRKLQEEVNEFLEDSNVEELADIMEVLFGLADALGADEEELMNVRNEKKDKRGGFKKGIVLNSVKE